MLFFASRFLSAALKTLLCVNTGNEVLEMVTNTLKLAKVRISFHSPPSLLTLILLLFTFCSTHYSVDLAASSQAQVSGTKADRDSGLKVPSLLLLLCLYYGYIFVSVQPNFTCALYAPALMFSTARNGNLQRLPWWAIIRGSDWKC